MAVRLPAAERRRQLLDVALDAFAERGYHRTSMNDVAEAAGVTKPVLYQHFPSKRELYLELLDDVGGRLREEIMRAAGEASTPHRRVVAGFTAYFRFVANRPQAFTVLFGGRAGAEPEFVEAVARVESTIADTVAALIDADVDPEHRRLLAHGIVGLAEATSRHWLGSDLELDPDRLAVQVADLAWAGLRGVHRV